MKKTMINIQNKLSGISDKEVKCQNTEEIFSSNCRTFTVAELWNIQRTTGRTRIQRRLL
jgi:hypothetical protein